MSQHTLKPDHILNLVGIRCPDFTEVLRTFLLKHCLDSQTVFIKADEPRSDRDITRLCEFLNHTLLYKADVGVHKEYVIQKGASHELCERNTCD